MYATLASTLKAILAVALVGGAATAVVAPAFDLAATRGSSAALAQNTPTPKPEDPDAPELDFETLLAACLDSFDPDSLACHFAQAKSGIGKEDFRAKIVEKLFGPSPAPRTPDPTAAPTAKPEPTKAPVQVVAKPKQTSSFDALLKACLETLDAQSDECVRAGEASGLGPAEWAAKIAAKIAAHEQAQFWTWFEKCLATRDLNSDACVRAEELSGMTPADFEAKFRAKLAAKDGTDFWTWFDKCLATRNVNSDACVRAQELIGYSDADFQAKFQRYLAERDAKATTTPKPTVKPTATTKPATATPAANFAQWFQICGLTRDRNSGECQLALVLSGMSPADFWAKVQRTFGF